MIPTSKNGWPKENGIKLVSLPEVLKEADYLSLHPDLNETSFHMMGEKEFNQMKPSAFLINTSRGKVVNEPDLIKALQAKRIAGAGLDVFETEPLDKNNPLTKMDNVIMLSHSAFLFRLCFLHCPGFNCQGSRQGAERKITEELRKQNYYTQS